MWKWGTLAPNILIPMMAQFRGKYWAQFCSACLWVLYLRRKIWSAMQMINTLSGVTRTKKQCFRGFSSKYRRLTSSGLKDNIEKTDTATTTIKLNKIEVHTKQQMLVLGVIFDSKLEWSFHMENSVKKARCTLQGLRVLNR